MPKKIFYFLFAGLVHCATVLGQSSPPDPVSILKHETITNMRGLRTELFKFNNNISARDSLVNNISLLINVTKTIDNKDHLSGIQSYFTVAQLALKQNTNQNKQYTIMQYLNNDLSLKLLAIKDSSALNFEPLNSFGKEKPFTVEALIAGAKVASGRYRLYWATFLGSDYNSMISNDLFEGFSNTFSNPFQLKVKLPGYITFWLKDINNNQVYIPDFTYKIITDNIDSMQIAFKILN